MVRHSRRLWIILVLALGWFPARLVYAEPPSIPSFRSQDRVLVLAPHEDDETLGVGGVLQQAVSVGAAVRVVYLTYGDHNELAFLLYRKRPWLSPSINERMGEIRRREAIKAMAYFGIDAGHLVFLGYPDGGTLDIWKQHWAEAPAFVSRSTHTNRVPYLDAFSYNKSHKAEEIVADLEHQLLEFRPTHIFVSHPGDGHPDHRSFYLFLQVALLNTSNRLPPPQVFAYPIHISSWPRPYGFHPDYWLSFPKTLSDDQTSWRVFNLTPEQVHHKYDAIRFYKSQTIDNLFWLSTFARRNELFITSSPVSLQEEAWSSSNGVMANPETEAYQKEGPTGHVGSVVYRQSKEGLLVQVSLRQSIQREMGLSLYAFGYRHDHPFPMMPKIRLDWTLGQLHVTHQGILLPKTMVRVEPTSTIITITIPWDLLGEPDVIFVQAKGAVGGIPVSQTGWRVFTRKLMESQPNP